MQYVSLGQQGFYEPFQLMAQGVAAWRQRQLEKQRMAQQESQFGRSLAQQQREFSGVSGGTQAQLAQAQKQFELQMPLRQAEVAATTSQAKTLSDRLAMEQTMQEQAQLPLAKEQLRGVQLLNRWKQGALAPGGDNAGGVDGSSSTPTPSLFSSPVRMSLEPAEMSAQPSRGSPTDGEAPQVSRPVSVQAPAGSQQAPVGYVESVTFSGEGPSISRKPVFGGGAPEVVLNEMGTPMRRAIDPATGLPKYETVAADVESKNEATSIGQALEHANTLSSLVARHGNWGGRVLFNNEYPDGWTKAGVSQRLVSELLPLAQMSARVNQDSGAQGASKSEEQTVPFAAYGLNYSVPPERTVAGIDAMRATLLKRMVLRGLVKPLPLGEDGKQVTPEAMRSATLAKAAKAPPKEQAEMERWLNGYGLSLWDAPEWAKHAQIPVNPPSIPR